MKSAAASLFLGALFGWIASRAGITDFSHITGMFALRDFHMFGVLGVAVTFIAIGLALLKGKPTLSGRPLALKPRTRHPGNFPGGMIFGAGWAITGACPGTSLVQVGMGHWGSLFTVAGLVIGILLYRPIHRRFFNWSTDSC